MNIARTLLEHSRTSDEHLYRWPVSPYNVRKLYKHCNNISERLHCVHYSVSDEDLHRWSVSPHIAHCKNIVCTLQEHWVNTSTKICIGDPCPRRHAQDTPNHLIFHANTIYTCIAQMHLYSNTNYFTKRNMMSPPFGYKSKHLWRISMYFAWRLSTQNVKIQVPKQANTNTLMWIKAIHIRERSCHSVCRERRQAQSLEAPPVL